MTTDQGQITIDEAAANADIQKIRSAIAKLQDAQNSMKQLKANAETMTGMTGNAIADKSQSLSKQVDDLIENLKQAAQLISKTVAKYKEQDAGLAGQIRGLL